MLPSTHFSLLEELKHSDLRDSAFAQFQERYRDTIFRWCRRRLRDDDAEDLTQDILIKLYDALPSHEHDPSRGKFRSWLSAVVGNALRNRLDHAARRPDQVGVGGTDFRESLDALATPESVALLATDIEQVADPTLREALEKAKAQAKPETWDVFRLVELEGRVAKEVADELGIKVGAVFQAKYRFRDLLKREYEKILRGDEKPEPR